MLCPQLKYKVLYRSLLGLLDVIRLRRDITYDCCGRYSQTWRKSFPWSENVHHGKLPGASVRNSARGKGHEEGGFGIRKGGIEPQETPCSRASTPKTRDYLLYCFMLSPTPLTLRGAVPHRFSWRRSKLAVPVNKNSWAWQGCLRSNLSAGKLACVTGLSTLLPLHTWLFTTSQP